MKKKSKQKSNAKDDTVKTVIIDNNTNNVQILSSENYPNKNELPHKPEDEVNNNNNFQAKRNHIRILNFDDNFEDKNVQDNIPKNEEEKNNIKNNIIVHRGLCFICTNNMYLTNIGIKCQQCNRTYHYKCLKNKKLYKEKYICVSCTSKN